MEQEQVRVDGGAATLVFNQSVICRLSAEMEGEEVVRELEEEVSFAFMGAFSKIRLQLRFPFLTTESNERSPNP